MKPDDVKTAAAQTNPNPAVGQAMDPKVQKEDEYFDKLQTMSEKLEDLADAEEADLEEMKKQAATDRAA